MVNLKFTNKIENPRDYFYNSLLNRFNLKKILDDLSEKKQIRSFDYQNKNIKIIPNVGIIEKLDDEVFSTTLCIEDEKKLVDIWYYSSNFNGNRVKIELKFKNSFSNILETYEKNHTSASKFDHEIIPLLNAGYNKYIRRENVPLIESLREKKPSLQFSYTKSKPLIPFKYNPSDDFSVYYNGELFFDFTSNLKFNKHYKKNAKNIINGYKKMYKQCKFEWLF
jgi:hypothetical protein